ncbi:TniQ family protein [Streptomyces sp. NBC_01387]|uniref:TniQ family protein n=1 Tax=Streptomyces sp. NBC_01387 TaxID=2903849 RepID=UPI0032435C1E
MSRTDVAARAQAATVPAQAAILTAEAWLQPPPAAPGVLRVRPLPFEATASYAQRLAIAYQLTLHQLLDGAGITLHRHGTPPTAELHLNHNAARHLAALTRIPLPHLTRALPHLPLSDAAHTTGAAPTGSGSTPSSSPCAPAPCAPATAPTTPPTPPGSTGRRTD